MFIIKISLVVILSLVLSLIFGYILIPILRKYCNQTLSEYLREEHKSKEHTPTMGGFIFIIPPIIVMLILKIFNIIKITSSLKIVIITFILYSIIGFIDDYLIVIKKNNKGLSEKIKFLLQLIVAIIFFYMFIISGNEPLLWIHTFNIKLNIGFLYGFIILFILVASTNAVNLTDGLDGLATSLSIISFITFAIITYYTGWLEGYLELTLFLFALVGSLIGFLNFNMYPAKIFMGDTGSLALGSILGSYAILTRHELLLIIIGFVFLIETLTCIIQRIYYKFTKKRIFPMTPIHHTFEKLGFTEVEIVKLFSIIGLLMSLISIIFGVII